MFVELHIIQNFAPSNLNRDDTNAPKDCEFGGSRRARISSQCIKRAIRRAPVFAETTGAPSGKRTRRILDQLSKSLAEAGKEPTQVAAVLQGTIPSLLTSLDKKGLTDVALYLGPAEVRCIRDELLTRWDALCRNGRSDAAKEIHKELSRTFKDGITSAPDIALFGRMLASKQGIDIHVDAACQVAHAISTHKVAMDMDFFTAVDDLQPKEETGAGMMGTVEFNSACFYRYANVDCAQLQRNLGGDEELARKTVEAFIRAAVMAIPTGKQNSMAAQNWPEFVFAVVRDTGLWSLANAFVKPIYPKGDTDLVSASRAALEDYWSRLTGVYGQTGIEAKAAVTLGEDELKGLGEGTKVATFEELIQRIMSAVSFDGEGAQ